MNLLDRLGTLTDLRPQTEALINLLRTKRQRSGARIVARLITMAGSEWLDQANAPAALLGFGLQAHGQTRADQAAANNRNVDAWHALGRHAACGGHQRFDLDDSFRHATGEDFATGLGHHHVVFNAYADAAPFLLHVLIVHGDIDARLDGHGHADFQLAPFAADLVLTHIMHIHPQPVAGAGHIEGL